MTIKDMLFAAGAILACAMALVSILFVWGIVGGVVWLKFMATFWIMLFVGALLCFPGLPYMQSDEIIFTWRKEDTDR